MTDKDLIGRAGTNAPMLPGRIGADEEDQVGTDKSRLMRTAGFALARNRWATTIILRSHGGRKSLVVPWHPLRRVYGQFGGMPEQLRQVVETG